MEILNWSIQTSPLGEKPVIVSEYVINELGVFIKRELRMPKNDFLTTVTGFRIGYEPILNTDYRAAPYDRNAILWHKITNVVEDGNNSLIISGNSNDRIKVDFTQEYRNNVISYMTEMLRQRPAIMSGDKNAAAWMCWRDDDEWEEPYAPLIKMIHDELEGKRFIEPEILEETVLGEIPGYIMPGLSYDQSISSDKSIDSYQESKRPNFCATCGEPIQEKGKFCGKCGTPIHKR